MSEKRATDWSRKGKAALPTAEEAEVVTDADEGWKSGPRWMGDDLRTARAGEGRETGSGDAGEPAGGELGRLQLRIWRRDARGLVEAMEALALGLGEAGREEVDALERRRAPLAAKAAAKGRSTGKVELESPGESGEGGVTGRSVEDRRAPLDAFISAGRGVDGAVWKWSKSDETALCLADELLAVVGRGRPNVIVERGESPLPPPLLRLRASLDCRGRSWAEGGRWTDIRTGGRWGGASGFVIS